jgi:hypothetical protein
MRAMRRRVDPRGRREAVPLPSAHAFAEPPHVQYTTPNLPRIHRTRKEQGCGVREAAHRKAVRMSGEPQSAPTPASVALRHCTCIVSPAYIISNDSK